jgi:hypothetical protein
LVFELVWKRTNQFLCSVHRLLEGYPNSMVTLAERQPEHRYKSVHYNTAIAAIKYMTKEGQL